MQADTNDPTDPSPEASFEDEELLRDDSVGGLVFSAVVLIGSVVIFTKSLSINSDAEIWPRSLSFILMVLTAFHLARSAFGRLRQPSGTVGDFNFMRTGRRAMTVAWLLVFIALAPFIGFGPATLVGVPAYMLLSGERSPLLIVAVTAVAIGIVMFLFGSLANVPVWEADL